MLQIDRLVRYVHITAYNHRLFPIQILHIRPEGVFPRHPVIDPPQFVLRVGRVDADKVKIGEFQCYAAPFVVMLLCADSAGRPQRDVPRKHGGSGVSLAIRIIPVRRIAGQFQIQLPRL